VAPTPLAIQPPMSDQDRVHEVTLTFVDLPRDVAERARTAQQQDPDLLSRILTFGFTQKVISETLVAHAWGAGSLSQ
jgi:hypothetical protein